MQRADSYLIDSKPLLWFNHDQYFHDYLYDFRLIHKHSIKQTYDWLTVGLLRLCAEVLAVPTIYNPHSPAKNYRALSKTQKKM